MARLVEVGVETALAAALCSTFHARLGIPPDLLTDDDITTILKKLEMPNRLEDQVLEFLAMASARRPREVVDLLLVRGERGDEQYEHDFKPLPYSGLQDRLNGLAEGGDYEGILAQVRDRALCAERRNRFWITKLFKELSFGYEPRCRPVLGEWINSGDPTRIEAATELLRDAPAAFVFDHFDFVSNAISRAVAAGNAYFEAVSGNFYACAVDHERTRAGGGPFPQDADLHDKATAAMQKTQAGSPVYRFYESLVRYAKENIRDAQARDEEVDV